jgi:hypothetical protein
MNMNTTVLREISFQLTQGNPWWGMLLANEYLEQTNPLRNAFVVRFKSSIGDAPVDRGSLADALIRGKCRRALSAKQLASVGSRVVRTNRTTRPIAGVALGDTRRSLSIASRTNSTARLALRQRNAHVARFSSCAHTASTRETRAVPARLVAI